MWELLHYPLPPPFLWANEQLFFGVRLDINVRLCLLARFKICKNWQSWQRWSTLTPQNSTTLTLSPLLRTICALVSYPPVFVQIKAPPRCQERCKKATASMQPRQHGSRGFFIGVNHLEDSEGSDVSQQYSVVQLWDCPRDGDRGFRVQTWIGRLLMICIYVQPKVGQQRKHLTELRSSAV